MTLISNLVISLLAFIVLVLPTPGPTVSNVLESSGDQIRDLQTNLRRLQAKYQKLQPWRPYIIINTTANSVTLHSKELQHEAKCSTGSYVLLKADDYREWLFKTPRGVFYVTVKLKDPWWYKPDWAFIEEGVPIPPLSSPKRYQGGVLGDYAVAFGHGYMIHGTLYKRLLGMPVTHGCVRLDDADMEIVFSELTHGSKVFVF